MTGKGEGMRRLTILMYHQLLDDRTPPGLKGLPGETFARHVRELSRRCVPVSQDDLADALATGRPLPDRAVLVTFDDGYASQFRLALPVLVRHGVPAVFYPTVGAAREGKVLPVNKIQLVLAGAASARALTGRLRDWRACAALLDRLAAGEEQRAVAALYPLDTPETALVKYLLQTALPEPLRGEITDALFAEAAGEPEAAFAARFYMDLDDLRTLAAAGMAVGVHGASHRWLTDLAPDERAREIDASLELVRAVAGPKPAPWSIAYPSGMYDTDLLALLDARGCAFGCAVTPGPADLDRHDRLALPRVDAREVETAWRAA